MRKVIIISVYFVIYWVLLPFLLVTGAAWVDEKLFAGLKLSGSWNSAGLFIFLSGIILMITAVIQFRYYGKEYPVSATPAAVIIQKGLFSVWRHPIYLFAIVTYTGLAFIFESYGFVFVVLPAFIVAVGIYTWFEEKGLVIRFGLAYEQHRRRVGLVFPGLHHWLQLLAFPLFKILFGIRVFNKKNIPQAPPFFIVSSHRNYLDTFLVCYGIPWPVKVISTFEMFRKKNLRAIFAFMGALPRKRYTHDSGSILAMKKALDQGYPVGIAPEGERSWTGITQPFKPEVVKMFLRYRHIPILPVRIEGNYHAWPRWSPKMLRARIRVAYEEIVHVEDGMTHQELEEILRERIQPRPEVERAIRCRSQNLIGELSRVIYRCPACRVLDALYEIPPAILRCSKCGHELVTDDRFNLKYTIDEVVINKSVDELYQDIKVKPADLDERIYAGPEKLPPVPLPGQTLLFAAAGSFFKEEGRTLVLVGTGTICLTTKGIHFFNSGEVISLNFSRLESATIESYSRLQLYFPAEKQLYQITLEKESVLKWQDTIVLIMDRCGLKKPITR